MTLQSLIIVIAIVVILLFIAYSIRSNICQNCRNRKRCAKLEKHHLPNLCQLHDNSDDSHHNIFN